MQQIAIHIFLAV